VSDSPALHASGPPPPLAARLPARPTADPDEILDRFMGFLSERGLVAYREQEEALLELVLGRHVILGTPTGSGKSLVAQGLHFKALCEGQRSFYTAPTKALVSEKFFALCADLGPERVGMLTGDASINAGAPVVCCTTEVLANMALRQGEAAPIPYAVLDEFHFYGDRERGAAWQIPLAALPHTQFLLLSATLGNTALIESRLQQRSGRPVRAIHSDVRPVPLDFEYRETPLQQTLSELVAAGKAPVYVVHFTQRECGEQAQGLTSLELLSRDEKRQLGEALEGARFDTVYGKDLRRFLRQGIGVHHAGLLPRYRLLVEQLAQRGLLRVICGTDTLGVGVNIPIRSVVFSRLCKFDGEKVAILGAREFKQIAGRAGRKGFDERGSVLCQAPEHVVEKRRLEARAEATGASRRGAARKRPPARGFVPWNRDTFEKLVERPPEMLISRFELSHGMALCVLQRSPEPSGANYRELVALIGHCHESAARKAQLRRRAAELVRSLRRTGVVELARHPQSGEPGLRVQADLQSNFSLHETLGLYLVEAVLALDPEAPDFALSVLSLVEAILENPKPILFAQVERAKRELLARLKAEGVPYEERLRELEQVSHPKPEETFIRETFRLFAERHPWVRGEDIRPKSVAREMFEAGLGFNDTVREYGVGRSEGLLLRYLSQVHNALVRTVPAEARSEALLDVIAWLRALLLRVDSSLVEAWEALLEPGERGRTSAPEAPAAAVDLARHERLLAARVRAELHQVVGALARGDYEEAAAALRQEEGDTWDSARLERALAPFLAEYGQLVFTPEARRADRTLLKRTAERQFEVSQVLLDPLGDGLWALIGEIDLRAERDPEAPLVRLRRIGS
jgi:hypothetical protein